jgi:hypothetical protein
VCSTDTDLDLAGLLLQSRAFRRHANGAAFVFDVLLLFLFLLVFFFSARSPVSSCAGGRRIGLGCGSGRTRHGRGGLCSRGDRTEERAGDDTAAVVRW